MKQKERSLEVNDGDVLREQHKFVRDETADAEDYTTSWETRMAVKYYRRLHKEFALVDLSRYKEEKIGLRWRTEAEVVSGKGQFECGNVTQKKKCSEQESLHSYEVNFKYMEDNVVKNELVKLRLCRHCAKKLPGSSRIKSIKNKDQIEIIEKDNSKKKKKRKKRKHEFEVDEEIEEEEEIRSKRNDHGSTSSNKEDASNIWVNNEPKATSDEGDMDSYLQGLFF